MKFCQEMNAVNKSTKFSSLFREASNSIFVIKIIVFKLTNMKYKSNTDYVWRLFQARKGNFSLRKLSISTAVLLGSSFIFCNIFDIPENFRFIEYSIESKFLYTHIFR